MKVPSFITLVSVTVFSFLFTSCKKDTAIITQNNPGLDIPTSTAFTQAEIKDQQVVLNPSGFAPLTALIQINTKVATRASLRVVGKNGTASDVTKFFDTLSSTHNLPLLGLYADYANTVELSLFDASGASLGTSAISIKTQTLSMELPRVEINVSTASKKSGMTLVSYLAYNSVAVPTLPFIFDEFGDIRWYLDYSTSPILKNLNYDDGLERLKNGNFYFGDINSGAIYEINMLGEIVTIWPLQGFDFHHKVLEKPNGNFLVSVSKEGLATVEDFIIEIDRTSKQIINTWDLRQSLQYSRTALTTNAVDWIHVNAVEYDASDNTIIISGRTQGVAKLDQNNKVVWILAPHKGWDLAGDGTDLKTKLLKPLDNNNNEITDTSVLNGNINHTDFEWNWCQHAVKLTPWGNISLFDNGDERNFITTGPYSRAVEFKIDASNMTVKQIWQYGKERGEATFSRVVSDVDYHADVNHYIFSPGAVSLNEKYGKVIEVSYTTPSSVLFEATIYAPPAYTGLITFHRTERLELYP